MEDYSEPGDFEDVEITCPNCGSKEVVVCKEEFGYYKVVMCHKCGYKSSAGSNKNCI